MDRTDELCSITIFVFEFKGFPSTYLEMAQQTVILIHSIKVCRKTTFSNHVCSAFNVPYPFRFFGHGINGEKTSLGNYFTTATQNCFSVGAAASILH
jgi:hypothetical protein